MPLISHQTITNQISLGVWDTTEDIGFFINALNLTVAELDFVTDLKTHRQREWLSSRFLCHFLLESKTRVPIIKDGFGKPYLENLQNYLSISHSKEKTAVIIADKPVGIDIQKHVDRINIIQHKFISESEKQQIDEEHLIQSYHLFWGAKESMYKAYGKKELDFKTHMHVYPFKYFQEKIEFKGWLEKEKIAQQYLLHADKIEDYYLVYSILNNV